MIINLIKFIHLLLALSLLGLTGYCLASAGSENRNQLFFIHKKLLLISVFAILTGSLLIYPKHFSFHTPWIQAAYIFLIIYCLFIRLALIAKEKITNPWIWRSFYAILIAILILVTHDAVTKTTLFSSDLLSHIPYAL